MENEKRLIDAIDAVTKISKKVTQQIAQGCHPQRVYAEVLDCIAEAPTVDAVEVVHGRWNEINQNSTGLPWKYRCNECGCPQDYKHNYCPNCGAKMDKEA